MYRKKLTKKELKGVEIKNESCKEHLMGTKNCSDCKPLQQHICWGKKPIKTVWNS